VKIIANSTFAILPREELTPAQTDEMFQLLAVHFDGVTRAQFKCDLAEKNWIVLIRRDTRLVGFSTLLVYESSFDGEPVSVVYSGDTIVAPEAWGIGTRLDHGGQSTARALSAWEILLAAADIGLSHLPFSAGLLARVFSSLRRIGTVRHQAFAGATCDGALR